MYKSFFLTFCVKIILKHKTKKFIYVDVKGCRRFLGSKENVERQLLLSGPEKAEINI